MFSCIGKFPAFFVLYLLYIVVCAMPCISMTPTWWGTIRDEMVDSFNRSCVFMNVEYVCVREALEAMSLQLLAEWWLPWYAPQLQFFHRE